MITRSLSPDAMLLEDAETDVKLIVKRMYMQGKTRAEIQRAIADYLQKTVKKLESKALVEPTIKSLWKLADKTLADLQKAFGANGALLAACIALAKKGKLSPAQANRGGTAAVLAGTGIDFIVEEPIGRGVPLQIYSKNYMKQVNRVMTEIALSKGIDPNDAQRRNSLRNLAEMQTRYESHQRDLEYFRANGIKLIICSTHADCSNRCYRWQGKVYSTDGTSGVTEDGRDYIPIEKARGVYYVTKKDHRPIVGGLGDYNCRHKYYAFKPYMKVPFVSKEQQERENKINTKQRQYEDKIRKYKSIALFDEDKEKRKRARKRAIELNKEYIAFSKTNKRAYYPDRVKILFNKKEVEDEQKVG